MNASKRPLSLTIIACVYIAVGTVGFVYHFIEFVQRAAFRSDAIWVELVELLAILCGVFMLRGRNWARWIAVAWIAFHVIVSAFHSVREFGIHLVLCAVIAWIVFRPEAGRYFGGARTEAA
jgi:hypothetical protein